MNKQRYLSFSCSLFFLLTTVFGYSQITPCAGNMAGDYPCDAVDMVSQVDITTLKALSGGNPRGNDIWGYVSPAGREYALMGLTTGTSFVDITDPVNPVVIGFLPNHIADQFSSWRDIREKNGFAYIGADNNQGHGLQVFDLSRLDPLATGPSSAIPVTFTEDGHTTIGTDGTSHNLITNPDPNSEYVYAVGGNICSGGVIFYDLENDPLDPDLDGCYGDEGYSHDMLCINYRGPDTDHIGKEICIGFNASKFSVIDITDKNDISLLSFTNYTNVEYVHQGWVTDDHKYLLVNDELDESRRGLTMRTHIFDIADLNNPSYLGVFDHGFSCIDHNLFIRGPYAYQANYESGLRVLDISDINNITEAASFDILPSRTLPSFNGAWGVYPFLPSGNILVSGINDIDMGVQTGGLFVLSPQLPHHFLETSGADIQTICPGDPVTFSFAKKDMYGFSGTVNYTVADLSPGAAFLIDDSVPGIVSVEITNTGGLTANEYFSLVSTPNSATPTSSISAGIIVRPLPSEAPPLSPADEAELTTRTPSLLWTPSDNTDNYTVEIATDNGFSNIVQSASGLTTNEYDATQLDDNTTYFWRVTSTNVCGIEMSEVFEFSVKTGIVPVELISFQGKLQEQAIHLYWETGSETNNAGFEIQRRQEDRDQEFQSIGWVDALSATGAKYSFTDTQVTEGASYYYRLRQIDLDQRFELSNTIQITVPGDQPGMIIYPNPVNASFIIDLSTPAAYRTDVMNFFITDLTGRIVKQIQLTPDGPFSSHEIQTSDLSPGVYVARMGNEGYFKPVKFVKL